MKTLQIFASIAIATTLLFGGKASAQSINDEVSIMVALPEDSGLTPDAASFMTTKLKQICAQNGVANDVYSRFCMSAKLTTIEKNVIGGGQPNISQTMMMTLNILDNFDQKIFASTSFNISGVGQNATKAEINAVRHIANNDKMKSFLKEGKQSIVAYYVANADKIIAKANALAKTKQYDAALYLLCSIPQAVGAEKYAQVNSAAEAMFLQLINHTGMQLLQKAKAVWGANQNAEAANEACGYIAQIYPESSAYKEGQILYKQICDKVKDDIKFERKKYQDQIDIIKQGVNAWRDVGVAYGKGQQPTTIREIYTIK